MPGFIDDPNLYIGNGEGFKLAEFDPDYVGYLCSEEEAVAKLENDKLRMHDLQRMLYAVDNHSMLLIFQAMDAAGKDSTIRHVFSGMFPQAAQVYSFKAPSQTELDHDFLWRTALCLPERGRISIFNRSYYEEVLVTRVHPEYILNQRIPGVSSLEDVDEAFWQKRFRSIRDHELHLAENGTIILKFFLNVSKKEQKRRFMDRIQQAEKNWKFNFGDLEERSHWEKYQHAYEEAIRHSALPHAPWYVIPADNKTFMRAAVCDIITTTLERLNLSYPTPDGEEKKKLQYGLKMLKKE